MSPDGEQAQGTSNLQSTYGRHQRYTNPLDKTEYMSWWNPHSS